MRCLLALAIVGCGGGPSVGAEEPEVKLGFINCTIDPGGRLTVVADYEVTLDVDQGFTATVDVGPSASVPPTSTFDCKTWTKTFRGSEEVGCERDSFDDFATITAEHRFSTTLQGVPTVFSVVVLGSALDAPLSDVMLANAGQTVGCQVP